MFVSWLWMHTFTGLTPFILRLSSANPLLQSSIRKLICDDTKNSNRLVTLRDLSKKHKFNLEGDTLVMQKKARYCTQLIKLDTKEYGLPQSKFYHRFVVGARACSAF